jgi:hypothetical protein
MKTKQPEREYTEEETAQRRDDGLRRALNTPPKQHKDMKKGKGRKRQEKHPTASEKQT